jgi:hypothetical protein
MRRREGRERICGRGLAEFIKGEESQEQLDFIL